MIPENGNKKRFLLNTFFLLMLSFALAAGCSEDDSNNNPTNGGNGNPGTNEVIMNGNTFSPASKTISVGTTIKWINRDGMAHTVTSGTQGNPSGTFDSGNLGQNGEFSYTFNTAGTFQYFCRLHNGMNGTIVVQ